MIGDNIGNEGIKYFSFIFTLFLFILIGNLLGMLPYSFTWTSHIIVTFAIAFFIFIGVTFLAIYKHGIVKFLKFFAPISLSHGITTSLISNNFTPSLCDIFLLNAKNINFNSDPDWIKVG